MQKQIPILFSTPMIHALLAGRKSQTRRIIKAELDTRGLRFANRWEDWHGYPVRCPYGQSGDLLWVRESWFPAAINGNRVIVGYHDKDPDYTIELTTDKVDFYYFKTSPNQMTNDKLPEEAYKVVLKEATAYAAKRELQVAYYDGATAWAPWKVKHDELQARSDKLRLALVMAVFALKQSYDVIEHPADGQTNQDSAIRIGEEVLQQFKDRTKEVDRPCPHCGKELSRDRNLCCRKCGKEVENG